MGKILIIDPGKGWGHFVSKMYCYQEIAKFFNNKLCFLTKKSTQAKDYLAHSSFCDEVIYLEEPKKGVIHFFHNIKTFLKNIIIVNRLNCEKCFVFHPSLRYLLIAKLSNIKIIWGLGLKFQNFFLNRDKKLYKSFFSQTVKNDKETLEFVKKITNNENVNFEPILRKNKIQKDTVGIIIAASGIEKRWHISNYIEIINFLKKENFKKFLIISGMDQADDERIIKDKFNNELEFIFSSDKKIKDIIPYLKSCKFCVGNDTGFSHLSVNFDIETVIIYGDCPPQNYSNLIYNVDIQESVTRSATSIHSIKFDKVTKEILKLLKRRGGRVVEGARLESV